MQTALASSWVSAITSIKRPTSIGTCFFSGSSTPMRGEEVKIYVALRPGYSVENVPPGRITAFGRERLAPFKRPRYIEYMESLPKTASGKIAKPDLRRAKEDLRESCFDVAEHRWR